MSEHRAPRNPRGGVVLVGDSIRLGYQPLVATRLEGVAVVRGTDANCASTRDILDHFDTWVTAMLGEGSVVHLNAGLHDLRRLNGAGSEPQVPIDEYATNLNTIVDRTLSLRACARLVLATSTPVDDARHAAGRTPNRFGVDVAAYNAVMVEVALRRAIEIHDLHRVIAAEAGHFLGGDGVHLTDAGNRAAAEAVVRATTAG